MTTSDATTPRRDNPPPEPADTPPRPAQDSPIEEPDDGDPGVDPTIHDPLAPSEQTPLRLPPGARPA